MCHSNDSFGYDVTFMRAWRDGITAIARRTRDVLMAHPWSLASLNDAQFGPSIPDLIVAATARARGLEILHYDRDFDTIAHCTEQPARWIVPPGTAR